MAGRREESRASVVRLLAAARAARRSGGGLLAGAAAEIETVLGGRLPPVVDCSAFLNRVSTLLQLQTGVGYLQTCIPPVQLPSSRARALAVILTDTVNYVVAGAPETSGIAMLVALRHDAGFRMATLAVAADGSIGGPVAPLHATTRMLRAAAIARALGGGIGRGYSCRRITFGIGISDGGAGVRS